MILESIAPSLDLGKVVSAARAHLHFLFHAGQEPETGEISQPPLPRVNVTLRTRGQIRGSMSGNGATLGEQLRDAVFRASRDSRFTGSLVKADLGTVSIEVWIQISSEPIPVEERGGAEALALGIDGVEFEDGEAFAYYKPSVALTSNFSSAQALFRGLCKKGGVPEDRWKDPACQLRKTTWIHFCETPAREVIQMTALRPQTPLACTAHSISDWLRDCVSYFKENQHSDGSFCYQYRPFENVARKGTTNPVRASGCAYAIAVAASSPLLSADAELAACADRAVDNLLQKMVPLEDGGAYISDSPGGQDGKLGTTALLLLALMTSAERARHEPEIEALLKGLESLQSQDGQFACAFGRAERSDSQINFFPGQAILALTHRTEQGFDSWKRHLRRAFPPYRDHFRSFPSTAFVGWHADAWSRAALLDSNTEYADFVFEQIDWLLQFQFQDTSLPLGAGGFSWNGKPPGYSSIVYTEAIARAAGLARIFDDRRWERYVDAFRAGLAFCSRLRLRREQSIFFPCPDRAIGGMAASISDFEVRSDVVQHAITLALASIEIPGLLE